MRQYLRIYLSYMKLNLASLFVYRSNFVWDIIASLNWGIFHVVTMFLLTNNTQEIYGWKRHELLVLTGVFNVVIGFYHFVVSPNLHRIPQIIHFGQLDLLMVKPVDTQFQLSFRIVNYSALSRMIAGFIFILYLIQTYHIAIPPLAFVYFSLLSLVGLIVLYSIWYLVITITVWHSNLSNITDILYDLGGMTRFPKEMYRQLGDYALLLLLPLILIMSAPTKLLLQRPDWQEIAVILFFAPFLFIISRKFWFFALRYYTSASS